MHGYFEDESGNLEVEICNLNSAILRRDIDEIHVSLGSLTAIRSGIIEKRASYERDGIEKEYLLFMQKEYEDLLEMVDEAIEGAKGTIEKLKSLIPEPTD